MGIKENINNSTFLLGQFVSLDDAKNGIKRREMKNCEMKGEYICN